MWGYVLGIIVSCSISLKFAVVFPVNLSFPSLCFVSANIKDLKT